MTQTDLTKRITSTYFWLRLGMGLIAFIFPFLLWIGCSLRKHLPLQGSMSAYYFAGDGCMRDWFVGILFAIGVMLYLYKGFSRAEDGMLNVAGIFALGIALFPMSWPASGTASFVSVKILNSQISVHGFCAVSFFLCIAYVCIFHATDTLKLKGRHHEDIPIAQLRWWYKIMGWAMVAIPVLVATTSFGGPSTTFFEEASGVVIFSAYWLLKSWELSVSEADSKAASGKLRLVKDFQKPSVISSRGSKSGDQTADVSPRDELIGTMSVMDN